MTACSYVFELPASDVAPSTPAGARDAGIDVRPPESDADTREAQAPFCASRAEPSLACIDFDNVSNVAALGVLDVGEGSQLALVTSIPLSPPRALLAVTSGAPASVTRDVGNGAAGITFGFGLLVSAWRGTAEAAVLNLANGVTTCRVALTGVDGQWSVAQSCADGGVETGRVVTRSERPIEPSRWHRFVLTLGFGTPKTLALAIDGVRVVDVPGLDALAGASAAVTLGIAGPGAGASAIVFEDDVLVTSP